MKKSILLLLALLHLFGCSSNDAVTNGNGGTTGDLVGTAALNDANLQPLDDYSGILVQIEGTSFSAITDSRGNWAIHNLPSKTYAITFSKAGFYTWHDKSFTFVAGEPVRYRDVKNNRFYVFLGPIPTFTITLDGIIMPRKQTIDSGIVSDNYGIVFAHTSSNAPARTYVGMCLVASHNPDPKVGITGDINLVMSEVNQSQSDSTVNLGNTFSYIHFQDFAKPGDTIYFKAYPIYTYISEYDAVTGYDKLVGYSPNGSNVLSGVMQ